MRRAKRISGIADKNLHDIRGLMEHDSWKNLGLANFEDGSARRDDDQKAKPTDRNDARK